MSRDRVPRPSGPPPVPGGRHRASPPPRPTSRHPVRRQLAGALAVVGALVTAGAAGALPLPGGQPPGAGPAVRSDRAGPAAPPPADRAPVGRAGRPEDSAGERWRPALAELDAVRAGAYARGDVGLLRRVWAPGERSRQDAARLRALVAAGCVARGVRHRFDRIEVMAAHGRLVRLRVVQWLPRSERVRSGRVVGVFAGTTPAAVTVELLATDDGWRLR